MYTQCTEWISPYIIAPLSGGFTYVSRNSCHCLILNGTAYCHTQPEGKTDPIAKGSKDEPILVLSHKRFLIKIMNLCHDQQEAVKTKTPSFHLLTLPCSRLYPSELHWHCCGDYKQNSQICRKSALHYNALAPIECTWLRKNVLHKKNKYIFNVAKFKLSLRTEIVIFEPLRNIFCL